MKLYRKKLLQPMRPYLPGEDLKGISVNKEDTPEFGGMIAYNPDNSEDKWYVAKKFFEDNYEEVKESLENFKIQKASSSIEQYKTFNRETQESEEKIILVNQWRIENGIWHFETKPFKISYADSKADMVVVRRYFSYYIYPDEEESLTAQLTRQKLNENNLNEVLLAVLTVHRLREDFLVTVNQKRAYWQARYVILCNPTIEKILLREEIINGQGRKITNNQTPND